MHKVICTFVLLALITPAFAADQFEGTWKINREKSTGPTPTTVEQLVGVADGDAYIYTLTGKQLDGAPFTSKFSIPAKGGEGKIIDAEPFDGVTAKPCTPTSQDFTFTIKGKPATHVHSVVTRDGKTLTATVHVMPGSREKPGTHKDVWDKQ